jgi:Glycosyltransferase (GlcNAc)
MSIGIRGFSIGYDFYAPERSVCFHHYATEEKNDPRAKVKHFWENEDRYAGYVLLFRVFTDGETVCTLDPNVSG